MVNRPKQIGTWGESATLKKVLPYFPRAHRLVLAGQADKGDVFCTEDFIIEVKAGAQTRQVGDATLTKWLGEARQEAVNSGSQWWALVLQRHGYGKDNAHRWWAYVPLQQLITWTQNAGFGIERKSAWRFTDIPVRMELQELLQLMAEAGQTEATPIPDAA